MEVELCIISADFLSKTDFPHCETGRELPLGWMLSLSLASLFLYGALSLFCQRMQGAAGLWAAPLCWILLSLALLIRGCGGVPDPWVCKSRWPWHRCGRDRWRTQRQSGYPQTAAPKLAPAASHGLSDCCCPAPGRSAVVLVDSLSVTVGQRILVELALQLRDQGLSAQEIGAVLEQEKPHIRLIALLDTLEYLKKGGRISPAVALAADDETKKHSRLGEI